MKEQDIKAKSSKLQNQLQRLIDASKEGNFDIILSDEGLSAEEAEIIRIANETTKNYKNAMVYDLMKYRLTSDALGIGLWDMDFVSDDPSDRNNRMIWSQEVRRMMGFTDERDFPNVLSSLTDRIHPDDREKAINAFANHVNDKTGMSPFDVNYRIKVKNGKYRYFHAFGTTLRNSEGAPLRVAGAIEDIDDDVKLQESLRKAQEERVALANLVNILNGLSAMICVTDPETDELLFINNSMRKAFGIDYECTGQKCYKVLRGFDERCDFCPCNKLMPESIETNEMLAWEHSGSKPEETYRYISRYIKWPGGKIAHIQNSVDITDIKQFQAELENQNLRLNLLIGGMKVGLWDRFVDPSLEYDDNKAQIWWSDEFRKLLGYTDENDFPNEVGSWLDRVHPDDLQKTIDAMVAFLGDKTGKTEYNVENRMRLKTGEYRWFRSFGSAIRDADGNPIRTAGATEDITARKTAEREIAEKNEFTKTLFDNAPVGLTIFDENYKFIDCNENILKIFGNITREEYSKLFGSKDHSPEKQPDGTSSYEMAADIVRRVVENGEKFKFEFVHKKLNGEPLPVELTITRIKQDNKYVGLAYIYDMSEHTRLKEELKSALHNAEKANKAKSDFLAKMSHEIRTPMNAILGITEIQIRSGLLSTDAEEALGKIYDSGNLLMGILNDILDLSKIEADKLEIIPSNYDISSLINDTVQLNKLRYDSKPIEFVINLDENTPHNLYGDELRIKQILNNILSNAFKYTDEGKIELSIYADPPESKTPEEDDVILVMKVSDTGQGMTKEQLEKLFDEYTRFNEEANRTTVGTGLGMSITKNLTELMGGSVHVESEPEKGTIFTVRLPQKRIGTEVCGPGLAEKLHNARFQSASITKKVQFIREFMPYGSVLIVDDVESNTYVARGMMLPYGLEIDTVFSGFEAIDKIKSGKKYDIVFMDHMMPKMDGIETTKKLREMGYTNTIIALTANALVGQADMFMNNGFDGYLSKPIDSRDLNYMLNEHIRNKKPAEVVEAARREYEKRNAAGAHHAKTDSDLRQAEIKKYVIMDIDKALNTLEKLFAKKNALDDADMDSFVVTVHGLKSAVANIGETTLSAAAARLEEIGKGHDPDVIANEIPGFVCDLRSLADRLKMTDESDVTQLSEEDKAFINEKLTTIIDSCAVFRANDARQALEDLTQRIWPGKLNDILGEISIGILHSDFKKAAATAAIAIKMLQQQQD